MSIVTIETLAPPPFCEKEALRYAGGADIPQLRDVLHACFCEAESKLTYKVCYMQLPVKINGDMLDFDAFSISSHALAKNLASCGSVLVFAATIGMELDRLIAKYGRFSPAKALMLQAIGAERIEALCDAFCEQYEHKHAVGLLPRFSPGYGDLCLETQKDLFRVLKCSKHIGLYLNESLLMSPSKSVTAFAGIGKTKQKQYNKCSLCSNTDCAFRSI